MWFFDTPGTPGGASIVERIFFESKQPLWLQEPRENFSRLKTIWSHCASNRFETDRHVKNKDRDHPQAQLFGIESAKSEQYFKTYTESFHYTTFGLCYPSFQRKTQMTCNRHFLLLYSFFWEMKTAHGGFCVSKEVSDKLTSSPERNGWEKECLTVDRVKVQLAK